MKNTNYEKHINSDDFFFDEPEAKTSSSLKQENELFNENDNIPGKIVRIKRKKESWDIYEDKTVVLSLPQNKFTQKECAFLKTNNGMMFLFNYFKDGWNSFADMKRKLKDKLE